MIRAENVCLRFDGGRTAALNGIDLDIRTGEFVAIAGPSGCGKSSLLGLIGLLERATSGTLHFGAQPYTTLTDGSLFRRRHIGFVFQSFHLIATLSALDNVVVATLGGPGKAADHSRRAAALLTRLGLQTRLRHRPAQLSGGERQRVAIARALINDPPLLLADEPTGSLDSGTAAQVLDLLIALRAERGLTLVLVTHDPAISARADRVVWLRDGRLDRAAAPGEVMA